MTYPDLPDLLTQLLVILSSFCFASSLRSSVLEGNQVFSCLFVLTSNTTFITYHIHASNFLICLIYL